MITGRQIRAARALVELSQDDLAAAIGLTPQAIRKIESGDSRPREGTMNDIKRAFAIRGVEFLDDQGVKLRSSNLEIFEGLERYNDFYEFFYSHLKKRVAEQGHPGEVCLSIYDDILLGNSRKNPEIHRQRMRDLFKPGTGKFRILTTKSDFDDHGYSDIRYQPKSEAIPTGFYAFGDCLALMSFANPKSPYIVLLQSEPMADAYRQDFDIAWKTALEPPVFGESSGIE